MYTIFLICYCVIFFYYFFIFLFFIFGLVCVSSLKEKLNISDLFPTQMLLQTSCKEFLIAWLSAAAPAHARVLGTLFPGS